MTATDPTAVTTRTEHDLLGDLDVPQAAYYGVHTARAAENFPITGITLKMYPIFIAALAAVKQAAAAGQSRHRRARAGQGRRDHRRHRGDPRRRGCTTSSSST